MSIIVSYNQNLVLCLTLQLTVSLEIYYPISIPVDAALVRNSANVSLLHTCKP